MAVRSETAGGLEILLPSVESLCAAALCVAAAACEAPRVVIETVNGAAAPLETLTLVGTVHVAPKGAPEQVKERVPVKPAPGVAWRLNCAV